MNISAASVRSVNSLNSHASRLNSSQQRPSDAVISGRSKLRGIDPQRLHAIAQKLAKRAELLPVLYQLSSKKVLLLFLLI
jgi:hypothetical protein